MTENHETTDEQAFITGQHTTDAQNTREQNINEELTNNHAVADDQDTISNPAAFVPATDSTSWIEKDLEYARHASELLPANKAVLFDALAAAGITSVVVTFEGYGDSGQIEAIEAKAGDAEAELPDDRIEIFDPIWGSAEIERQTVTVCEALETLAYAFLRQTHVGWENDDGAYGDFTFDVAERTITLGYNERYTETNFTQHEF